MKPIFRKGRLLRAASALVSMAVLATAMAASAFAYSRVDTAATAGLTAGFAEGKGAQVRLYKVAEVSDAVRFTLTDEFKGAEIDADKLQSVEQAGTWTDYANTFDAYARAKNITPTATAAAGEDGNARFESLSVGLYLLTADTTVVREGDTDYSYTPGAALVLLPTLQQDDSWEYNPTVTLKTVKDFVKDYQDLQVTKKWSGGDENNRPDVKIQLVRDSEVVETVTLNADNDWTYTWKDLTSRYVNDNGETKTYSYTVNEESVPSGYKVSVSQNGTEFTVTNTRKSSGGGSSSSSETAAEPTPTPVPAAGTLPQTGALNWPVPVLTVGGLVLVAAGWLLLKSRKEN